jgi:hypothetical protein
MAGAAALLVPIAPSAKKAAIRQAKATLDIGLIRFSFSSELRLNLLAVGRMLNPLAGGVKSHREGDAERRDAERRD